jgi:hypothetical protein
MILRSSTKEDARNATLSQDLRHQTPRANEAGHSVVVGQNTKRYQIRSKQNGIIGHDFQVVNEYPGVGSYKPDSPLNKKMRAFTIY